MTGSRGVNSFMYWRPNLAKDSPDTAKNVIFRWVPPLGEVSSDS